MNIQFMGLNLFNSIPKSTRNLDCGPFKSLIKIKLYEHYIYTIKEYFDIVHSFIEICKYWRHT